jgi:hypothetical protein
VHPFKDLLRCRLWHSNLWPCGAYCMVALHRIWCMSSRRPCCSVTEALGTAVHAILQLQRDCENCRSGQSQVVFCN